MPDADTNIHIGFAIWSLLLTGFGVFIMWNWNRLWKQLDKKVDQEEMTQLRDDLRERWKAQDVMHRENRQRLDRILERLPPSAGRV